MPGLSTLKSIKSGNVYALDRPTLILGRVESCDIQISTGLLSREHAVILVAESRVVIKDLNSTNGTFVNSMRIHAPTDLQHGDVITMGDEKLVFIAPHMIQDDYSDTHDIAEDLAFEYQDNTSNKTMFKSTYSVGGQWPFAPAPPPRTTGTFHQTLESNLRSRNIDKRRVPAVLVFKSGKNRGRIIELKLPFGVEMQWSIGRNSLSDVVLDDPTVSSRHAVIRCINDEWELLDNQSTNGVKLNDRKVSNAICRNADVITVGAVEFLFRLL